MKVVLFCGGLGTRLREYTEQIPKPMVKIGYRPILWHLMKYYAHFGHKDFVLCLGYKADVDQGVLPPLRGVDLQRLHPVQGRHGRSTLENNDIEDWNITFVDTGLHSNIGQRLVAVEEVRRRTRRCSSPTTPTGSPTWTSNVMIVRVPTERQGRHLPGRAALAELPPRRPRRRRGGRVRCGRSSETDLLINAGFFAFRQEIFDYIEPGEELVVEPFAAPHRRAQAPSATATTASGAWTRSRSSSSSPTSTTRARTPWEVWKSAEAKTAASESAAPRFEAQDANARERTAVKSVAGIRS